MLFKPQKDIPISSTPPETFSSLVLLFQTTKPSFHTSCSTPEHQWRAGRERNEQQRRSETESLGPSAPSCFLIHCTFYTLAHTHAHTIQMLAGISQRSPLLNHIVCDSSLRQQVLHTPPPGNTHTMPLPFLYCSISLSHTFLEVLHSPMLCEPQQSDELLCQKQDTETFPPNIKFHLIITEERKTAPICYKSNSMSQS